MIHVLRQTQLLPISIDEAWKFFSTPTNLNDITPTDMAFRIIGDAPVEAYEGQMIVYRIKLFPAVSVEWVTEITHIEAPYYFVDEQRFGPYAMWHHEHRFRAVDGGVEMQDTVHYKLPFGAFGNLFHGLLVKPKLAQIFDFRRQVLEQRFPNKK
jgi:ligand-binding SRPBCC domain-containing protein